MLPLALRRREDRSNCTGSKERRRWLKHVITKEEPSSTPRVFVPQIVRRQRAELYDRKKIQKALAEGKPIPTELRDDAQKLKNSMRMMMKLPS